MSTWGPGMNQQLLIFTLYVYPGCIPFIPYVYPAFALMCTLTVTFKGINWSRRRWPWEIEARRLCKLMQLNIHKHAPAAFPDSSPPSPPSHTSHLTHTHLTCTDQYLVYTWITRFPLPAGVSHSWMINPYSITLSQRSGYATKPSGSGKFFSIVSLFHFLDLFCQILIDHKYTHTKRGARTYYLSIFLQCNLQLFFSNQLLQQIKPQ